MRILSLHLPRLPTDRLTRGRAPEAPLATVAKVKGAQRLASLDARAEQLGLRPGMALADARAMHPGLLAADADARAEAGCLENILAWCRRYTPLVARDGADGLLLDISGAAHLFGGEAALCADIERRLAAQGFAARAGIGPNPEAAWAIARFSHSQVLAADAEVARLPKIFADFPLAALGLDEAKLADLAQAGLRRIGDIVMRPRAPIAARFGAGLFRRLDALTGGGRSAISPVFEAPPFIAERRFAEGLAQLEAILATILALAKELCALLERHGEGARRLGLTLFRVDGAVRHIEAGAGRPQQDPQAIARLFAERIAAAGEDGLETGYGFDVVRLSALAAEPAAAVQTTSEGALDLARERDLADLVDRLGARLGLRRVVRLRPQGTHIPEFAVAAVPAADVRGRPPPPLPQAGGDRPIRLLRRPEPIEAIAMLPDGPPLRFRWRRALHEVVAIEGPERIAPEWWKLPGQDAARDYFRAEDADGRRFWLYREGAGRPHWFMHGLFA